MRIKARLSKDRQDDRTKLDIKRSFRPFARSQDTWVCIHQPFFKTFLVLFSRFFYIQEYLNVTQLLIVKPYASSGHLLSVRIPVLGNACSGHLLSVRIPGLGNALSGHLISIRIPGLGNARSGHLLSVRIPGLGNACSGHHQVAPSRSQSG